MAVLSGCADSSQHLTEAREQADRGEVAQAASLVAVNEGDSQKAQEHRDVADEAYRLAIIAYQQAGAERSRNADLTQEYAQVAEAAGHRDLAARAYDHLVQLEPDEWTWKLNAGRLYRLSGGAYSERALELLQHCARSEEAPTEVRANANAELGFSYWWRGLYENAYVFFRTARDLKPGHVTATIGAAAVEIRRGDVMDGAKALDGLLQISDADNEILNIMLGNALAGFEESRAVFPDTTENHYAYARLLVRVGDYYKTMLALERTVALDDQNYAAYNMLGGVLMQLGEPVRSKAAYQASLRINPNQPRTQEILSQMP